MLVLIPALLALGLLKAVGPASDTLLVPEAYSTIQAAIDAARDGDRVSVDAGTYAESLDFLGKQIAVLSRQGPQATIIQGDESRSVVHFVLGEGPDTLLQGFTVRGGGGTRVEQSDPNRRRGGGILCLEGSSPSIVGNWVLDNGLGPNEPSHRGKGAGLYVGRGCAPRIEGNWISANHYGSYSASGWGGGIAMVDASPWILRNRIDHNYAGGNGGGIAGQTSAARIEGNEIVANTADWGSIGGGILCVGQPPPSIRDNLISENHALELIDPSNTRGGGLYSNCNNLVIERNRIVDNRTDGNGAGLFLSGANVRLVDNLIARNVAGGLGNAGRGGGARLDTTSIRLIGNTLLDNEATAGGPALSIRFSGAELEGCIVWGHGAQPFEGAVDRVSYCDLEGGWAGPGEGNLDQDPGFDDALGEGALRLDSPCIDRGPPGRRVAGPDLGGTPRLLDGDLDLTMRVDMGAREYSNLRLEVRTEGLPPRRYELRTTGKAGMFCFLFVGLEPGAVLLSPFGSLLLDIGQPYRFVPFAVVPDVRILAAPDDLPGPLSVVVQELGMQPYRPGGNFSNAVMLDIE